MPGLLYADDLTLCGELEEDLRAKEVQFAGVCRRRGLKVNASKSKVMVLNEEEGFECEVHLDGIRFEHVSNLNIWHVFWMNQVQMGQSVVGKW